MKKRRFLKPNGDYIFFTDIKNEDNLLCMTREVHATIKPLTFEPEKAPEDSFIKAFPLEKTSENQIYDFYDIVVEDPIDFHVNRIKWIWTYADPNDRFLD